MVLVAPLRPQPVSPPGRTGWLDLARVLAIAAVVAIHVVAPVVEGKSTATGSPAWWFADVVDAGLRWSVPLFVMVSGALLLAPGKPGPLRPFLLRRLQRVGVPLVVWTLFYLLFRSFYDVGGLSAEEATVGVLAGSPFLHLYFLYVIAGLSLLTPFLRVLLDGATRGTAALLAALALGAGAADQVLSVLVGLGQPNAVTRSLPFVGYFVAGAVLRDLPVSRRRVHLAAVGLTSTVLVTALGTGAVTAALGWGPPAAYLYGFLSPPVVVMSLSVFVLLKAVGESSTILGTPRVATALRRLSALSFGVYLVHPAILLPLRRSVGLPADLPGTLAVSALLFLVVLVASTLAAWVLERTPGLRTTVGAGPRVARSHAAASSGAPSSPLRQR